jgi:hypothetical protein
MTQPASTHSLVVERPHPPEKILCALTQSPLMEEWLMKNVLEAGADAGPERESLWLRSASTQ